MAFCITFGTHDFHGKLKGYENITAQCHNCGNWSARCITEWPFFTICFIPLIPLAFKKYKLVACPVCHFKQDLSTRQDIQEQAHQGGHNLEAGHGGGYHQGPPPGQQGYGGPPQGGQQWQGGQQQWQGGQQQYK